MKKKIKCKKCKSAKLHPDVSKWVMQKKGEHCIPKFGMKCEDCGNWQED